MSEPTQYKITLIGVGTIGISFAALHLKHNNKATISIYDPRPDLQEHIELVLPGYIDAPDSSSDLSIESLQSSCRLTLHKDLKSACENATIVQEQGPENVAFKSDLWDQVERLVSRDCHLWSSTSGIPASVQFSKMSAGGRGRLLVVHPFNPPHIMPLIEIVPSSSTRSEEVEFARSYFETLGSGHRPIVVRKEIPGFVGNRLAFTLFREACHLVSEGVITAADLDTLVESSIGPRWAVQGPFKSYNMGGLGGGLAAFLKNLGRTIQDIWNDGGKINFDSVDLAPAKVGEAAVVPQTGDQPRGKEDEDVARQRNSRSWTEMVIEQTDRAYGKPTTEQYQVRDQALRRVLEVQRDPAP